MLLFRKNSKTTAAHGYLLYAHSEQIKSTQNKPSTKNTKKQIAQRVEKIVGHTVVDKNKRGALNAMRSKRWETKNKREVEQATPDETEM